MTLLEAFWTLRNAAEAHSGACYSERKLTGTATLSAEVKEALLLLQQSGSLPDLKIGGRFLAPVSLPNKGEVSFEATAPKSFFENIDELIQRHQLEPPDEARIFSIQDEDTRFPLYLQTVRLCALLKSISASSDRKKVVLHAKDSLEIPYTYTSKDLRDIPRLSEMEQKLALSAQTSSEEVRIRDIYVSLFTQSIYDVASQIPRNQRLPHLIEHFEECLFRFRLAFRLFSEEANKAIERYEEKRAGMIAALNGVLGNIQTSLVGVPLAGILALKEMKKSPQISYENVIIAFAVVVIGLLLLGLSWSQGKALDAIKLQHDHLQSEIDASGGGRTKISELLASMASHHSLIRGLLIAVRALILAFIVVAIGAVFYRVGA